MNNNHVQCYPEVATFEEGNRVAIVNCIDGTPDYGTVCFVEHDEHNMFDWVYVVADHDSFNVHDDPKFQKLYWEMRASIDPHLILIK